MAAFLQSSRWQHGLTRAWQRRGGLAYLLWPLSYLFGLLVALRRKLYLLGLFPVKKAPVPVLVVGNVIAGGSGKTPLVILIVQHLQARGLQVGVISRGYGRRSKQSLQAQNDSPANDVGDEPLLIARATTAPVFVASRRMDAIGLLLQRYPQTQLIVCDDGLQHLGMWRDFEICVFDDRGLGNGFLLPAGPLREPWPRQVDWVLHTGRRPAFTGLHSPRHLSPIARRADGSQVALAALAGIGRAGDKPQLALAAIANPEDFFAMLREQGLPLACTLALPDHYDFSDFDPVCYQAYTLICTEKDAVKLWPIEPSAIAVALALNPEPIFFEQLDDRLTATLATWPKQPLSSSHGHTIT